MAQIALALLSRTACRMEEISMADSGEPKVEPASFGNRAQGPSFYKRVDFYLPNLPTVVAIVLSIIALWSQRYDREASRIRQARAQILQALDNFELERQQIERGIPDSVQAARGRAGARWVLPSGSAGADEVRRSLRPLEELLQDEWLRTHTRIRQILTESGVSDTTLATAQPFQELQPYYEEIEARKDSALAKLRRAEDKTSRLR
jgi:hypothetical protein